MRKRFFSKATYAHRRSFYQDRLGTNIGKAKLKYGRPFSQADLRAELSQLSLEQLHDRLVHARLVAAGDEDGAAAAALEMQGQSTTSSPSRFGARGGGGGGEHSGTTHMRSDYSGSRAAAAAARGGDSSELSVQVSFDSEVSVARGGGGGGGGGDYSRVPMTAFDGEGTHIPNSSGDYRRHHGAVSSSLAKALR